MVNYHPISFFKRYNNFFIVTFWKEEGHNIRRNNKFFSISLRPYRLWPKRVGGVFRFAIYHYIICTTFRNTENEKIWFLPRFKVKMYVSVAYIRTVNFWLLSYSIGKDSEDTIKWFTVFDISKLCYHSWLIIKNFSFY